MPALSLSLQTGGEGTKTSQSIVRKKLFKHIALCIKNENREEKDGEMLEKNDAIDEL
jgi:hypothetical protein